MTESFARAAFRVARKRARKLQRLRAPIAGLTGIQSLLDRGEHQASGGRR